MNDISPELKREWIVRAIGIAGFTENPDFPGIYTQEHGMKKIVVDLTDGQKDGPAKTSVYFMENKQKVVFDDEHDTLAKVSKMITEAEDGRMPSRTEPDIIVNTGAKEGTPEQPDDAQAGPVPTAPHEPTTHIDTPTGALVPLSTTSDIVRPAVSAQQAIAAWNEFQDLKRAILQPSDVKKIQGKDFMVKSAWRKFATFFNLNDKIVEETQTSHQDGQGWTWKIKVICTAPNGRFTEGVGICSTSERTFAHLEHDTYATAHTRAKNRAISDMVAAGEVSAEEVSA